MFKGVLCGSLKQYFAVDGRDTHGKLRFYEVTGRSKANDSVVICDNTCIPKFRFVNERACSGYEEATEDSYRFCKHASLPFATGSRIRECKHPDAVDLAKGEDLIFSLEEL